MTSIDDIRAVLTLFFIIFLVMGGVGIHALEDLGLIAHKTAWAYLAVLCGAVTVGLFFIHTYSLAYIFVLLTVWSLYWFVHITVAQARARRTLPVAETIHGVDTKID